MFKQETTMGLYWRARN